MQDRDCVHEKLSEKRGKLLPLRHKCLALLESLQPHAFIQVRLALKSVRAFPCFTFTIVNYNGRQGDSLTGDRVRLTKTMVGEIVREYKHEEQRGR